MDRQSRVCVCMLQAQVPVEEVDKDGSIAKLYTMVSMRPSRLPSDRTSLTASGHLQAGQEAAPSTLQESQYTEVFGSIEETRSIEDTSSIEETEVMNDEEMQNTLKWASFFLFSDSEC
jgi:hypothetical protein